MTVTTQPESDTQEERVSASLRFGLPLAAVGTLLLHFGSFNLFKAPVTTDIRYFLYFAWRTAEGETPHLDLFDPKSPLASLVGAVFWSSGEALGIDPIIAVRIGYVGLAAACGLLCFYAFRALGKGHAACAALRVALERCIGSPIAGLYLSVLKIDPQCQISS